MIRQYINALYIRERREEVAQFFQVFILVGDTWNEDVTNPYRLVDLAQIAGTIQYILIGMKREFTMLFFIDMLDIKKNSISDGHQTLKFLEVFPFSMKGLSRGIKTGIDATLMGFLEKFDEKVYLHQCLATAHGNSSIISPITLESLCLVQQVIGTPLLSYPVFQESGLWQNWQRIGQPCRKIKNRMPGPSTEPKLSMLCTNPLVIIIKPSFYDNHYKPIR